MLRLCDCKRVWFWCSTSTHTTIMRRISQDGWVLSFQPNSDTGTYSLVGIPQIPRQKKPLRTKRHPTGFKSSKPRNFYIQENRNPKEKHSENFSKMELEWTRTPQPTPPTPPPAQIYPPSLLPNRKPALNLTYKPTEEQPPTHIHTQTHTEHPTNVHHLQNHNRNRNHNQKKTRA